MNILLIEGARVLGMTRPADVTPDGAILVEDGAIVALHADARKRGAEAIAAGRRLERVDARGLWLMPGFVQTHIHLCQTLLRNGPDDLPLLPWLRTYVWPGEAAHDEASLEISARLGLAELLAGGTTALLDMGTVHHTDAVFRAAEASGMRVTRIPEASAARKTASVWWTVPMSRSAVVPPARSSARPSRAEISSEASSCAASPGQTYVLSHGRSGRSSGPFRSSVWQRWICVWTNPGISQRPRASTRSRRRPAAMASAPCLRASAWSATIAPSSTRMAPSGVTSAGRVIPRTRAPSMRRMFMPSSGLSLAQEGRGRRN